MLERLSPYQLKGWLENIVKSILHRSVGGLGKEEIRDTSNNADTAHYY